MVFVSVIETVFDHTQPTRPWAELFANGFAPPIRENWRYRIVVNLVWFARNYLNFVVGSVLCVAYWFPGFLFTVLCTLCIHAESSKQRPALRAIMRCVSLLSLLLNNFLYGWLSGFLFSVAVASCILLHAVFCPYDDERVQRYKHCIGADESLKTQYDSFLPRTPVMEYTATGKGNFPDPLLMSQGDDAATSQSEAEEPPTRTESSLRAAPIGAAAAAAGRPTNTTTSTAAAAVLRQRRVSHIPAPAGLTTASSLPADFGVPRSTPGVPPPRGLFNRSPSPDAAPQ